MSSGYILSIAGTRAPVAERRTANRAIQLIIRAQIP